MKYLRQILHFPPTWKNRIGTTNIDFSFIQIWFCVLLIRIQNAVSWETNEFFISISHLIITIWFWISLKVNKLIIENNYHNESEKITVTNHCWYEYQERFGPFTWYSWIGSCADREFLTMRKFQVFKNSLYCVKWTQKFVVRCNLHSIWILFYSLGLLLGVIE